MFIVNVLEKTPTNTKSIPDVKGCGGGGGGVDADDGACGGGGVIFALCECFNSSGTFQANGGNGGAGV